MKLNTITAFLLWLTGMSLIVLIQVKAWQPTVDTSPIKHDPRIGQLTKFFERNKCTYAKTKTYLAAADKYGLDFRLLPAISVIESSCGRHYLYNNLFGWGSSTGLRHFQSIETGVDFVTQQLAQGGYYRNKTLSQKLKIYNSINPRYSAEVVGLMDSIK